MLLLPHYHVICALIAMHALLKYGNIGYAKHGLIFSYFCLILGPTRALCPVRSTTDGDCCIFPFAYQGKEHHYCTSVDSQDLGCQTSSVNKQGQMYGTCNCKWCRYNISGNQECQSCHSPIPPFLFLFILFLQPDFLLFLFYISSSLQLSIDQFIPFFH